MPVVCMPLDLVNGRSSAPPARLRVVPWGELGALDPWRELAGRAGEPNPFFESWCLIPALEAFDVRGEVQLALLERDGRLEGIMPLARFRSYDRYPLPHLGNWLHANAFCGSPLVAAGAERAFWRELLAWADENAGAALFLHLHELPAGGAAFHALRDEIAAAPRPAAVVKRSERAMLSSTLTPEAYLEQSLSGKKRKELRRQHNRLAEEGALAFERRQDGESLERWIEAFLALEAAGWKGTEGSALASRRDTRAFFVEALSGAAAAGRLERLTLSLDARPVAMLANFLTPPGAFSFKTAFDERLARFSPGVLLQRENLALLARDDIAWADSCAAAGHPMIEHIWREKRTILRVSLGVGGQARRALGRGLLRAETGADPKGL